MTAEACRANRVYTRVHSSVLVHITDTVLHKSHSLSQRARASRRIASILLKYMYVYMSPFDC